MRNSVRYDYDKVGKLKSRKKGGSSERALGKKKVWLEVKLDTQISNSTVRKSATGVIGRIHPHWDTIQAQ